MQPSQTTEPMGWDRRAWAWGFVSGNLAAMLVFILEFPPSAAAISRLFTGTTNVLPVNDVGGVILFGSYLLLPGLMSAIGRRLFMGWGLLPLVLLDCWFVGVIAFHNSGRVNVGPSLWAVLLLTAILWLVSSGPVSLTRWLLRRARERRDAARAKQEALRVAASVPQEGVWPPPPDRRP